MKVDNIRIISGSGTRNITFAFRDPLSTNLYKVKSVYGLDADVIVSRYRGRGLSGTKLYEPCLQGRDIVLRLGLNPNNGGGESHSSLRDELYKLISDSKEGKVSLEIRDGTTVRVVTQGFISRLETNHFTEEPEAQLTISCDDGVFKSPTLVSVPAADRSNRENILVNNPNGTAPSGIIITATPQVALTRFRITDLAETWMFEMVAIFNTNRDIVIDSNKNQLFAGTQVFSSRLSNAQAIVPGSTWPMVYPGENRFKIHDNVSVKNVQFTPNFWGV